VIGCGREYRFVAESECLLIFAELAFNEEGATDNSGSSPACQFQIELRLNFKVAKSNPEFYKSYPCRASLGGGHGLKKTDSLRAMLA